MANDSILSGQFNPLNLVIMKKGYSPFALKSEQVGGRQKFESHHLHPIGKGGEVYDVDNMVIMPRKAHIAEHSKKDGEPQ